MNKKYISFPGKTFLIGEYAVLKGAPAILVNTKPSFDFFITKGTGENNFHPQSPAGQWLKLNPRINQSYHIQSRDPYLGKGGFGFSSAQFNLVYLLSHILDTESGTQRTEYHFFNLLEQTLKGKPLLKLHLLDIWKAYRKLSFEGVTPSGADVISQWLGRLCLFVPRPFTAYSIDWPFPDLDFFLVHTGVKLNTWEHLRNLYKQPFSTLSSLAKKAIVCVNDIDKEGFISTLNEYSVCLEQQGLTHKKTKLFLNRIKKYEQVITAKGCGSMGAEVIAIFFDPKNKEKVKAVLSKENIIAHSDDLTDGYPLLLSQPRDE